MKFKRLSNHFWKCEIQGTLFVGTWEQLEQEIKEVILCSKNSSML